MLVDTGSDYRWIPATSLERIGVQREKNDLPFVMANGERVARSVGFAIIRLDRYFTIDEIVFAEKPRSTFARSADTRNVESHR